MCRLLAVPDFPEITDLPDYAEIADKISHFVNKNRCFPDYQDILTIVRNCNGASLAVSIG